MSQTTPADVNLALFRAYLPLWRQIAELSFITWLPVSRGRWLRWLRIIPVVKFVVVLLAGGRSKRILDALGKACKLRFATANVSARDEWKVLSERIEAMKEGLPSGSIAPWVFAFGVFLLVLLIRLMVPGSDHTLTKAAIAVVTVSPEKFVELAADPAATEAFPRLLGATILLLIFFVPIVVYHFRFVRFLFNRPDPPSPTELGATTIADIWRQRLTASPSVYTLEVSAFESLGEPITREISWDSVAIIVAFGYHGLGPGLLVGIVGAQVFAQNRDAGWLLFFVAAVNMAIGFGCAYREIRVMRARSRVDA